MNEYSFFELIDVWNRLNKGIANVDIFVYVILKLSTFFYIYILSKNSTKFALLLSRLI